MPTHQTKCPPQEPADRQCISSNAAPRDVCWDVTLQRPAAKQSGAVVMGRLDLLCRTQAPLIRPSAHLSSLQTFTWSEVQLLDMWPIGQNTNVQAAYTPCCRTASLGAVMGPPATRLASEVLRWQHHCPRQASADIKNGRYALSHVVCTRTAHSHVQPTEHEG